MGIPTFLRVENETVFFKGPGKKLIFYVPEEFFTKHCATEEGEYIELIGAINYSVMDIDSSDYSKKIKTFDFPSEFTTKPGASMKVKNFQILPNAKPEDYRLLVYTDNDVDEVISSIKVPQDIINVEHFLRLFVLTGKIPKTIPYDALQDYFLNNININGNSYKVTAQLFGVLISEVARAKNDVNIPFRLSKPKDMLSYETMRIASLPKLNGPFNSLTSENWDESLIGAVLNPDSKGSPLEPVMMGGWSGINKEDQ